MLADHHEWADQIAPCKILSNQVSSFLYAKLFKSQCEML